MNVDVDLPQFGVGGADAQHVVELACEARCASTCRLNAKWGPLHNKEVQCSNVCGRRDAHSGDASHNCCKEHLFLHMDPAQGLAPPPLPHPAPRPTWIVPPDRARCEAVTPAELRGSSGSSTPPPAGTKHSGSFPSMTSGHPGEDLSWRDRVNASTIPQLRQWLARRGLPTGGPKLQLVQDVLRASSERPPGVDDYPLIPWCEKRAAYLREQRLAQVAAASVGAQAAASSSSSSVGPLALQPKASMRAMKEKPPARPKSLTRGLKDPLLVSSPESCGHPRDRVVARANQHASWTKCLLCGSRLSYVPKRKGAQDGSFVGVVEIPSRAPSEVLVVDMKSDVERMIIDSGCKRSVAGRRWHRRMHALLRSQGLKPQKRCIDEVFRFGNGALVNSSVSYVYPIGVYGTHGTVDVAMVKECPPLLSNRALKELGVSMDWSDGTISVRAAQAFDKPMEVLASGHPSMVVTDFSSQAKFPDEFLFWGSETEADDPGVRDNDADETTTLVEPSFTAFATGTSRQVPRGVKKRLTRIARGLLDTFSTNAQSLLASCRERWCVNGGGDATTVQEDGPAPELPEKSSTTTTTSTHDDDLNDGAPTDAFTTDGSRKRRRFKVVEIFSWAMVLSTLAINRDGWTAGPVCSIETGYDLTTSQGQRDAWALLEREDPDVVTLAWPCTDWSLMQNLNLNRPEYWKRLLLRRQKSVKMIKFSADVATWQNKRHRPLRPKFFLAENPWSSRAWQTRPGRRIQTLPRAKTRKIDQCTLGLKDPQSGHRLKKCTRIVTDSPTVAFSFEGKRHSMVCGKMSPVPPHRAIEGSTIVTLPDGSRARKNLSEVAGGWSKPMCKLFLDGFEKDLTVGPADVLAAGESLKGDEEQRANTKTMAERRRKGHPLHMRALAKAAGEPLHDISRQDHLRRLRGLDVARKQRGDADAPLRRPGRPRGQTPKVAAREAAASLTRSTDASFRQVSGEADATMEAQPSTPAMQPQAFGPLLGIDPRQPVHDGPLRPAHEAMVDVTPPVVPTAALPTVDVTPQPAVREAVAEIERRVKPRTDGGSTPSPQGLPQELTPPATSHEAPTAAEPTPLPVTQHEPTTASTGVPAPSTPAFRRPRGPGRARLDREEAIRRIAEESALSSARSMAEAARQEREDTVRRAEIPDELEEALDATVPGWQDFTEEDIHERFRSLVTEDPTLQLAGEELEGLTIGVKTRLRTVPEDVKREVRRAHHALGHCGRDALVRLCRTANKSKEHIFYAKLFKCPVCMAHAAPGRIPTRTTCEQRGLETDKLQRCGGS